MTAPTKTFDDQIKTLRFVIPWECYIDKEYTIERRKILLLLGSILDTIDCFKSQQQEYQIDMIINIELSCFGKAVEKANDDMIYVGWNNLRFIQLYQLICSRVTKNIDPKSEVASNWLVEKIVSGNLPIEKIGWMSSEELTNKTVDIKQAIELRRSQKLVYKTSSLYACKNCKARACTIRTQQMRSLDEGFTIIATCTICGFRFMISG
jgi:DNA-directed RNA polymerase subunit M/transcription elongation factor TFIIS